ncbi:MAG: alkaline phosphatase family protein [Anaerolineae bacterium]|nr:alkaline phosphatase family protein [Anaerolineae bacterium]MCB0250185.1 alkaline phosphatase family protein [Anaerolineae bacterium]MCB9129439.1 alkaline phosphatase family protein [Anaerolineales bacterium]MCB9143517.1 alkaline phosphatase family protein [Anaerolineales bacterium]MCO5245599.1 alkaline phosphatase family protein [Anaerolineae bacterium]
MTKNNRLLIIGLDGATFDLIRPWATAGKLPNIARLMRGGSSAPLRSVPNQNSAPAWSSFATGKNPGKHGIFYFDERIEGTYNKRYLNGGFRQGESWWSLASQAGKVVGVVNVPMSYPAEKVNGVMLAGLDAPGVDSPGFSHPPELIDELQQNVGDYIIEPGIPSYMKMRRRDLAEQAIFDAADKRAAYTRYLMSSRAWDVFHVTFTAPDASHHFFWRDMDLAHPEYNPVEAVRYGDTVERVYERMDQIVGELTALAPDATVMLMSDHGGGFNQRGAEYLNDWLASIGLLHYLDSGGQRPSLPARGKKLAMAPLKWGYNQVDRRLPRDAKLKLVRLLPGVRERMEMALTFGNIDWTRTKAYAYGARDDLWINLQGREPGGIVPPEEYEALRDEIIEKLHASRDVLDHEPVLEEAIKREDVYHGPNLHKSPDIIIRWKTTRVIRGIYLPQPGKEPPPVPPLSPNLNNGGHRLHGIFVMAGDGVREGHRFDEGILWDLAPTILHYLGVPVPDDMDGRVLAESFDADWLAEHPVTFSAGTGESGQGADYDSEAQALIDERLRGLGYVG